MVWWFDVLEVWRLGGSVVWWLGGLEGWWLVVWGVGGWIVVVYWVWSFGCCGLLGRLLVWLVVWLLGFGVVHRLVVWYGCSVVLGAVWLVVGWLFCCGIV